MEKVKRLSDDDREFFRKLANVIFSNPFSIEQQLIEELLGKRLKSFSPSDELKYMAIVPLLENRLEKLRGRGVDRIQSVHSSDREPLEYAYLFLIYHQFLADIDALIQHQITVGHEPVAVPFYKDLIGQLTAKGFNQQQSYRYLALFYQLRRAFYFIVRALAGDSASMITLRHALWNNVFTADVRLYADHLWDRMEDFSTLLLGETGTGKGTAAAAIGRSGLIPFDPNRGRFKDSFMETFVSINLSEFPDTLIESELFGHRKGAFTGAIEHHSGLFERCSAHGSLFIDEIGDVSIPTQIKLLNVLQDRKFTPVGSHDIKRFEGRVIAATNRSIFDLRKRGEFRDDFYYRLSSDVIEVPPLRVRLKELPDELDKIVALLVQRMTGNGNNQALIAHILDVLKKSVPDHYHWPGNVRELEQAVRRIILNGTVCCELDYGDSEPDWLGRVKQGQLTAQAVLSYYCNMLYQQLGTYEAVAERTALDRRTVKKYIDAKAE